LLAVFILVTTPLSGGPWQPSLLESAEVIGTSENYRRTPQFVRATVRAAVSRRTLQHWQGRALATAGPASGNGTKGDERQVFHRTLAGPFAPRFSLRARSGGASEVDRARPW
jgi:hypothetical protein